MKKVKLEKVIVLVALAAEIVILAVGLSRFKEEKFEREYFYRDLILENGTMLTDFRGGVLLYRQ